MAYSANQTTLSYRVGNAAAFTQIPMLKEVPEFGGTPEKIDVTTLSDRTRRHIPGIRDYGDLVFKFLYDNSVGGNYRVLKKLAANNTTATFKLEYPDGTAHEFNAIPSVKMDAGTVNGALTFSATMMLQGDIGITDGTGRPGQSEPALPEGLLRSRILTPDDYTFTPQSKLLLISRTGHATAENASDTRTHERFHLRNSQYGQPGWNGDGGMDEDHSVVTAEFSQNVLCHSTWNWQDIGIPTTATDIQKISFSIYSMDSWIRCEAEARSIHVEPFTAESGFETFRVYGDFEVDFTESGGGLNTVAYSIVIGARPNRSGDNATPLFEGGCCCRGGANSGVRFEKTSGTDRIAVADFGIQAAIAATNTFVNAAQHVLEFNEPLQPGDTATLIADITTKKAGIKWGVEEDSDNATITITQPIERQMMLQGRVSRDESMISMEEQTDRGSFTHRAQGFRATELFEDKVVISTGFSCSCCGDVPYRRWFADVGTVTQTLDIHHLEVISRT